MNDQYKFADLSDKKQLVEQIQKLETELKNELGHEVTLIAYERRDE